MTGHLLVTALDPAVPATMSPRILIELLRGELGFDGLIITDGIEMRAVADRYGLAGASVRAIAAGADAICVGGGPTDEATVDLLRDALVDAVRSGDLAEERLADAARRVGELADWTLSFTETVSPQGESVGLVAARRAVRVVDPGGVLPLTVAPHVIELAPFTHEAIDKRTPWGVAEPLSRLISGVTSARVYPADAELAEPVAGRPLVIVVRDAHRLPWMSATVERLLAAQPDGVVVELGLPGPRPLGAAYLATHGAARVCGQAAAEVLAGRNAG
jgi:beta-N-acetylhexosaminidase